MDFLLDLFSAPTAPDASDAPPVCPDCLQELVRSKAGEIPLHKCPHCQGTLLDLESFQRIGLLPAEALAAFPHTAGVQNPSSRACPVCELAMVNFLFRGQIWLDWCQDGHGMWLDRGELATVHALVKAAEQMSPEERSQAHAQVARARSVV